MADRDDRESELEQEEEESPLSEDSQAALREASKGKSRGFVLLRAGSKILSLIVYKRGSADKYIKEAKKLGTGQAYYGVVSGQGRNLTFQLSRADGFDKEPCKKLVLRKFLDEEGDISAKPVFSIVDRLTAIE